MVRSSRLGGPGLPPFSSPDDSRSWSVALAASAVVVRAVEAVLVGADDRDLEADVAAVEVVAASGTHGS